MYIESPVDDTPQHCEHYHPCTINMSNTERKPIEAMTKNEVAKHIEDEICGEHTHSENLKHLSFLKVTELIENLKSLLLNLLHQIVNDDEAFNERIGALCSMITELTDLLDAKNEQITRLSTSIEELESKHSKLEKKNEIMMNEIDFFQSEISSFVKLKHEYAEMEYDQKTLIIQNKELHHTVAGMRRKNEEITAVLHRSEGEKKEKEKELCFAQRKYDTTMKMSDEKQILLEHGIEAAEIKIKNALLNFRMGYANHITSN